MLPRIYVAKVYGIAILPCIDLVYLYYKLIVKWDY